LTDKDNINYTNKNQTKSKDLQKNEIIVVDEGVDDEYESQIKS
jgi:hypothetical protein